MNVQSSDETLLHRIAEGDNDSLAALARRHQGLIWSLSLRWTRSTHDAEDIAQETLLRIYRSASQYRPIGTVGMWIGRIVVNLCLDLRRRRRRAMEALPDDAAARAEAPKLISPLEQRETAQRVQTAIDNLPERQRMVILLHRYQGMAHREIAQTTGWTESAVESLLVRAYASLRQKLLPLRETEF